MSKNHWPEYWSGIFGCCALMPTLAGPGTAGAGHCTARQQPEVESQARRDLPIVLKEGSERSDHSVLAVLVAERSTGRPSEHELGEPVTGVSSILRIGREFPVEGELAAGESCGVAVNI